MRLRVSLALACASVLAGQEALPWAAAEVRLVEDPQAAALAHEPTPSRRDERVSRPFGHRSVQVVEPLGRVVIYRTPADQATPAGPAAGELNDLVLEVLRGYPTDGTHPYHWPKSGGWKGCTRDLAYAGELLAAGDPQGRAYCCGLTFEVFLEAWMRWCRRELRPERILDSDLARVRRIQSLWFGSRDDPTCLQRALVANGIGVALDDPEAARPGDFVQFWRNDGSGHSVVFLAWVRGGRSIAGLRYWSTQAATNGIGERTERIGPGPREVDRARIHIARAGLPPP
jgi:hypothetical protein